MEHPVPQNVTSFEFHLVGDMTIRQFLYLASGLGLAYLVFVILLPPVPLLALPLMGILALLGISLAFLPILDRPLDYWILAFFKAIYSPTQAYWQSPFHNQRINPQDPIFINRLQTYLSTSTLITKPSLPATEVPLKPAPPPALPRLTSTPVEPVPVPVLPQKPSPDIPSEQELYNLMAQARQEQLAQAVQPPLPPTPPRPQPTLTQPQSAKTVASLKPLSLTSTPNVISGIVTDSAGNYLEGVIVITHNKDGIPVRASKTNKLGQFTGATPLPSGIYSVTLEKDTLEFAPLQVTLSGNVLLPLQISAKRKEIIYGQ